MFIVRCLSFVLFIVSSTVMADCVIDGAAYPEGTNINGYVCVEGKWVEE